MLAIITDLIVYNPWRIISASGQLVAGAAGGSKIKARLSACLGFSKAWQHRQLASSTSTQQKEIRTSPKKGQRLLHTTIAPPLVATTSCSPA